MGKAPKRYDRLRFNSGQHRRILLTGTLLGLLAFVPVGLRLYGLMIREYDYYSAKALSNQSRSTPVAARRGDIVDRNMEILATDTGVENVYLNPRELKQSKADIPAIAAFLGPILEKDPSWIREQAEDRRMRYKQVGWRIDEETAGTIRSYINENSISGIHLEPASRRT